MKKGLIITTSIILFVIALISILFGAVFRVRNQSVVIVGEDKAYIEEIKDEILSSAGIKNGKSIFMLDKESAINNIEANHPYVKVVQIKTVSVTEIEIKVRKRYETYFIESNGKFYVVDEDLKVLQIVDTKPELTQYISNKVTINDNTKVGEFLGNSYHKQVAYNLFVSLYEQALLERAEIAQNITSVSFTYGYTLDEEYTRLILQTKQGVVIDIYKPENDLGRKINIAFSTLSALEESKQTQGSIKIFLNEHGEEKLGYFEP